MQAAAELAKISLGTFDNSSPLNQIKQSTSPRLPPQGLTKSTLNADSSRRLLLVSSIQEWPNRVLTLEAKELEKLELILAKERMKAEQR